jgi:hypothetical protein
MPPLRLLAHLWADLSPQPRYATYDLLARSLELESSWEHFLETDLDNSIIRHNLC